MAERERRKALEGKKTGRGRKGKEAGGGEEEERKECGMERLRWGQ